MAPKPRPAKVKLLRAITTRGGTTFKAGVVMSVSDVRPGHGMDLYCHVRGWYHAVHGVPSRDVVVVEWKDPPEPASEEQANAS